MVLQLGVKLILKGAGNLMALGVIYINTAFTQYVKKTIAQGGLGLLEGPAAINPAAMNFVIAEAECSPGLLINMHLRQ